MKHIKLFEDYSEQELKDLIGDLRSVGQALTEEEEEMLRFINQFGGGMPAEDYAEYLYDYYTNPEDYDIDTDGEYYGMIDYLYGNSVEDHARYNLSGPMRMGTYDRWSTSKIEQEPLYKLYIEMSNHYNKNKR
jgi:hypothetical protein